MRKLRPRVTDYTRCGKGLSDGGLRPRFVIFPLRDTVSPSQKLCLCSVNQSRLSGPTCRAPPPRLPARWAGGPRGADRPPDTLLRGSRWLFLISGRDPLGSVARICGLVKGLSAFLPATASQQRRLILRHHSDQHPDGWNPVMPNPQGTHFQETGIRPRLSACLSVHPPTYVSRSLCLSLYIPRTCRNYCNFC